MLSGRDDSVQIRQRTLHTLDTAMNSPAMVAFCVLEELIWKYSEYKSYSAWMFYHPVIVTDELLSNQQPPLITDKVLPKDKDKKLFPEILW